MLIAYLMYFKICFHRLHVVTMMFRKARRNPTLTAAIILINRCICSTVEHSTVEHSTFNQNFNQNCREHHKEYGLFCTQGYNLSMKRLIKRKVYSDMGDRLAGWRSGLES